MSSKGKTNCVTVMWKIENFSACLSPNVNICLRSRILETKTTEGSASWWSVLVRCSDSKNIEFSMVLLKGENRDNLYELSLITSDGEFPITSKSYLIYPAYGSIEKSLILCTNRESFLPQNTLTFCCRIKQLTIKPGKCLFRTVLHQVNLIWNIEGFSFDSNIEKIGINYYVKLILYTQLNKIQENSCKFSVTGVFSTSLLSCQISIKDDIGRVLPSPFNFPGSSWNWDIEFHSGSKPENSLCLEIQGLVATHMEYQQLTAHPSDTLTGDLLQLYKDKVYSDATLNSEGKTFPVHRGILAARSPVFRAMFEKDEMSEGRSGVVDIDDIDSETVDRMLVFLYSDSLDDLQWGEASALYYAADKYAVQPLKKKCGEILKSGLAVDNACDLLVLADRHSDQELMKSAVDFILDHEEVLSCPKWKSLEDSNPRLLIKIMRELYSKKGNK